jgi:RimJ/RimL family protein N-acetyltransferase
LYSTLEKCGFYEEARLKEHCFFNNKFLDVIIHSKFNSNLELRRLNNSDKEITFEWANDSLTRKNSFSSEKIEYSDHSVWFDRKLKDENAFYLIGEINTERIGLVRFDYDVSKEAYVIGITIAKRFRGKKLSSLFLEKACKCFLATNDSEIIAYIKEINISSAKAFERAGFKLESKYFEENINTLKYIYEQ